MIKTPYYLINEKRLLKNLKIIDQVRKLSGAKVVLALKCFSTWSVFDLMRKYLDGTTSSSVYEARLGYEKFGLSGTMGKETHSFCVGYKDRDIKEVLKYADKIIFNSVTQLQKYYPKIVNKGHDGRGPGIGLRINPGFSYSHFDIADPNRARSRLGVNYPDAYRCLDKIDGLMFHFNCENGDFINIQQSILSISTKFKYLLRVVKWVSLGGGIAFTNSNYLLIKFANMLKNFSKEFGIQVYLEPGDAVVSGAAELVTTVVDITNSGAHQIAIIDASVEAHMLDHLIYRYPARVAGGLKTGSYVYSIAGRSCLAGDVFGTYKFAKKLKVGDTIRIQNAAAYTMVKKNWFNGLDMPSIVVKRLDGKTELIRQFTYNDFLTSHS